MRAWRRGRCVRPGFEQVAKPGESARSDRAGGASSRGAGPTVVFRKGLRAQPGTPGARRARRGRATRPRSEAVRFPRRPAEPIGHPVNARTSRNTSGGGVQSRFGRRRLRPRRPGGGSRARCDCLGCEAGARRARRAHPSSARSRRASGRRLGAAAARRRRRSSSSAASEGAQPTRRRASVEGSARNASARTVPKTYPFAARSNALIFGTSLGATRKDTFGPE